MGALSLRQAVDLRVSGGRDDTFAAAAEAVSGHTGVPPITSRF
jgi:hypothetical protein